MKILIEHFDTCVPKNTKPGKADLPSDFQNFLTLRKFWVRSYKHADTSGNMHEAGRRSEFKSTNLWISRCEHHFITL